MIRSGELERLPEPGADPFVGESGGGKVEIDEAVRLAGVADFIDVDAVLAKSISVRSPFVSKHVASAQQDERPRQPRQ
jgi:hypothetical protein